MIRKLLALSLAVSVTALAEGDDDAPIPYDDDGASEQRYAPKKARKKRRTEIREEDEEEKAGEESMAGVDDPNIGVGGELIAALGLLDASRGGVDPRFAFGVRFTWEWGRLIPDEYLREMFFADVQWTVTGTREGTNQVATETTLHNFTVAPAFALPFGRSFMSAFAQVGVGFNFASTATRIDNNTVNLAGTKFLFQYGIGLRGRPALVGDGSVRLTFRIDVTRFIRGYMHDMFIGGGVGLIF
jgi:hypothetical protein